MLADAAELPFGNIAIIALELLFGAQLNAEVGKFALAALAMLAGAVFPAVYRAFRAPPDILAHPAIKFVFGALALRHDDRLQFACFSFPERTTMPDPADAATASPGCRANCESAHLATADPIVKKNGSS